VSPSRWHLFYVRSVYKHTGTLSICSTTVLLAVKNPENDLVGVDLARVYNNLVRHQSSSIFDMGFRLYRLSPLNLPARYSIVCLYRPERDAVDLAWDDLVPIVKDLSGRHCWWPHQLPEPKICMEEYQDRSEETYNLLRTLEESSEYEPLVGRIPHHLWNQKKMKKLKRTVTLMTTTVSTQIPLYSVANSNAEQRVHRQEWVVPRDF
jgi:hypothetical protein